MSPERSAGAGSRRFSEWLVAAGALAVTAAGAAAMVSGTYSLGAAFAVENPRATIAAGSLLLACPALLAIVLFLRRSWRRTLALDPPPRRVVLLSVLLGGALWILSIGVIELQSQVWPPSPEIIEFFRRIHQALAPEGPFDALVSVAVIALLPALSEELVVRGMLLPALRKPFGSVVAVLASSLAFALMHDPFRFAFTLVVGIAFGALRLRSGSLWPPIVAHASLNTLTFLVAPLVDDPAQATYEPQPLLGAACLVIGGAFALPLLRALRPSIDSSEGAA